MVRAYAKTRKQTAQRAEPHWIGTGTTAATCASAAAGSSDNTTQLATQSSDGWPRAWEQQYTTNSDWKPSATVHMKSGQVYGEPEAGENQQGRQMAPFIWRPTDD